ncbi:uncharacterized protein JCM6883_000788 [Sporobolomyces salmoneus]|uniref:uncharacterized protein n=1 Tax=Sporobolomyces salmoneus TaxID=183962 RepID=UPI003181ED47
MASTTATSTTESITNTISDAANYEGNKEVAKGNTDAGIADRASAGLSAIGNKTDESKHDSKADAFKTSAKN